MCAWVFDVCGLLDFDVVPCMIVCKAGDGGRLGVMARPAGLIVGLVVLEVFSPLATDEPPDSGGTGEDGRLDDGGRG